MKIRFNHGVLSPAAAAVAAAGVLLLMAAGGCNSDQPKPATPGMGTGSAAAGAARPEQFLKENRLDGRVVLMQFAAVGDPLGDLALGRMAELERAKAVPDLVLVRVDESADRKAADAYCEAKSPGFLVRPDAGFALASFYGVTRCPMVVLVDRFGHVRYRGPLPEEKILADWAEWLAREKSDPGADAPAFGISVAAAQRLLDETRLADLAGAVKPLRAYAGKGGLMAMFVDTTCPFAGTAINDLPQVAATLGTQGMAAVLVNLADKEEAVRKFYAGRNVGTPVVFDPSKATQKAWQVTLVPTVFVFDADGTLLYRGDAVWQDLASAAEGTLKLSAGTIKFVPAGTGFG